MIARPTQSPAAISMTAIVFAIVVSGVRAEAQAPSRERQGPPPVASQCADAAAFCVGTAPSGAMYVADHNGNWTPVRPTELRQRAAAHATAQGPSSRAFVIYWATARRPNVDAPIRNAGITNVQYLEIPAS